MSCIDHSPFVMMSMDCRHSIVGHPHGCSIFFFSNEKARTIKARLSAIDATDHEARAAIYGDIFGLDFSSISDGRPCTMEAFVATLLAAGLDAPVIKGAISAWIKGDWQAALLPLSDDARARLTGKGGAA